MTTGITSAHALEISCTASNQQATIKDGQIVVIGDQVAVPVQVLQGAQLTHPQIWVKIGNSQVNVSFNKGDEFEKQTYLKMSFDDLDSTVYNLKDSLYMLEKNGIRFQCNVKKEQ